MGGDGKDFLEFQGLSSTATATDPPELRRLLLNVTKVTTDHQKLPKCGPK